MGIDLVHWVVAYSSSSKEGVALVGSNPGKPDVLGVWDATLLSNAMNATNELVEEDFKFWVVDQYALERLGTRAN